MPTPRPSRAEYFRQRRAARAVAAGRTPGKPGPEPTRQCGTYAAARRHQRKGEPTCSLCRLAMTEYINNLRRKRKNTDTKGATK